MEQKLIALAHEICRTSFMDYPDYDPDIELSLADAITILVMENVPNDLDIESSQVYDLINKTV